MRIDLRRIESIKQQSAIVGNRVRAKVVKNKVAAPFRVAEFDIMFNEGISRVADLVDLGVLYGILKKSGAFYSWDGTRLGQGRENSKDFLRENKSMLYPSRTSSGRLRSYPCCRCRLRRMGRRGRCFRGA